MKRPLVNLFVVVLILGFGAYAGEAAKTLRGWVSDSAPAGAQGELGGDEGKCVEQNLDQLDPRWTEIEVQYGRLREANRKKDLPGLLALRTPEWQGRLPGGGRTSSEEAVEYSRRLLEQVKQLILLSNTILHLTACGDDVTATVLQQWSRIQVSFGTLRRYDTAAVQDEVWVKTPEGWKVRLVKNIHRGAWMVDNKRIPTDKPYDPEAPEYDPYDPRPRKSLAEAIWKTITEKGAAAAAEQFRSLRDSREYYLTGSEMNSSGYRLLQAGQVKEAIEVSRLNTEAYPKSANAYDSLGEAYMANGEKTLAIANYQKSLKLDPKNTNAVEMLKKLRGQ